jgi:hypothetical protein
MKNSISDLEQFELWLFALDDTLDEFLLRVAPDVRCNLDFSCASLDALEGLIIHRYPSTEAMLDPKESSFVNGLACYIGETFRRKMGGRWTIRLDDPKFAFYGLPILENAGKHGKTVECPLTLATAAANRRVGNYLRSVLDSNL